MAAARVVTYEQAVDAARRLFVRSGRVDMSELAEALAVSRATLYRVVPGRDRLIGDVLWQLTERSLRGALAARTGSGVDRLVGAVEAHLAAMCAWPPLRRFLLEDTATAQRVLFMPEGLVHDRAVQLLRDLLDEAERAGELALPYPARDCAHLLVTVTESVVYDDLFGGREPDLELASKAQRAILRGP